MEKVIRSMLATHDIKLCSRVVGVLNSSGFLTTEEKALLSEISTCLKQGTVPSVELFKQRYGGVVFTDDDSVVAPADIDSEITLEFSQRKNRDVSRGMMAVAQTVAKSGMSPDLYKKAVELIQSSVDVNDADVYVDPLDSVKETYAARKAVGSGLLTGVNVA